MRHLLRSRLEQQGFTSSHVSITLGIPRVRLTQIVMGFDYPTVEEQRALAALLNDDRPELFDNIGDRPRGSY